MKTCAFLLVAGLGILFLTGCTAIPFGAPNAALITIDVGGPVAVGDPGAACTKMGTAECTSILVVAWGDASIQAAADSAGIKKIHHVDCKVFSVLGIYAKYETIVYGE